jgi:hypothetical protein
MSKKYKFADNDKLYFVSFAVTTGLTIYKKSVPDEILTSIDFTFFLGGSPPPDFPELILSEILCQPL